MAVRLGINPLTWSNDDMPELGAGTPLETCLAQAKLAGYSGVELGHKFPRRAELLAPILRNFELQLISGWYGSRLLERSVEAEIAALQDHLALLAALGSEVMVYCEVSGCVHGKRGTALSARPVLAEAAWPRFCARLSEIGRYLAGRSMRLAYHHHMGTIVQTERDIDRLMAHSGPEVALLLDTGHLTFAGGDPIAVAGRHAARIAHVHCKDVRKSVLEEVLARDASFLDAVLQGVFTVPGDGCVDFGAVLRALSRSGYRGWLVVEAEQDPEKAHPLTYARLGHESLAARAAEAGLTVEH